MLVRVGSVVLPGPVMVTSLPEVTMALVDVNNHISSNTVEEIRVSSRLTLHCSIYWSPAVGVSPVRAVTLTV